MQKVPVAVYSIVMLNQAQTLIRRLRRPKSRTPDADPHRWRRDPLSHPDLQRMSLQELADLPFDPTRIGDGP